MPPQTQTGNPCAIENPWISRHQKPGGFVSDSSGQFLRDHFQAPMSSGRFSSLIAGKGIFWSISDRKMSLPSTCRWYELRAARVVINHCTTAAKISHIWNNGLFRIRTTTLVHLFILLPQLWPHLGLWDQPAIHLHFSCMIIAASRFLLFKMK